ncbi:unnamed protein product [Ixodes hexagonus]
MAPVTLLLLLTMAVVPQDAASGDVAEPARPAVQAGPVASAGRLESQQSVSERHGAPQPAAVISGGSGGGWSDQGRGLAGGLAEGAGGLAEGAGGTAEGADAPQRLLRGGRRDDYEEEYDEGDDDEDIMDVSGAARVKTDAKSENMQIFLRDIEKLYSRGFRRSRALRSKTASRNGWQDVGHIRRHDEQLMAADQQASENLSSTHDGTNPNNVVLAGRKSINLTSLSYVLNKPVLTVQAQDLNKDDKVFLYVSVAFEEQVGFRWFLNGRPFEEYDSMQTLEMTSFVDPVTNKTLFARVSMVEVDHFLKLPTATGKYEVHCAVTADSTVQDVKHVFAPHLTDICPPANCFDRHAICSDGKCVCAPPYPVVLSSVHTTCRTESFLETPCFHDDQCLYTANNSECIDLGWCACRKGYGRTVQHLCVQKTGLNSRCDSDVQCKPFNASCVLSHCTCNSDSVEEGDRCIFMSRSVNRLHSGAVSLRWSREIASAVLVVGLTFCSPRGSSVS